MAKKNNDIVTTQIFDLVEWNDQNKSKKVAASLMNDNGFIIFFSEQTNKGSFKPVDNFWCRQSEMGILSALIDAVIKDIKKDDYSKKRFMKGNKSNLYILAKKSNDKLFVAIKVVPKEDDHERDEKSFIVRFPSTETVDGISDALVKLMEFKKSIDSIIDRSSISYHNHYEKYISTVKNNNNSSNSSKESNDSEFEVPF